MPVIYEGSGGEVGMTFKPPGHYEARDCAVQPIQTDPTLRVNSLRRRPGVWFIPRLPGLVAIADCGRSHRAIGVRPEN